MDYDDNEFQGQNRQLAGEGYSKVSPVSHPYALPKFDFDDTLHENLNFNSLVENEVFLGQEDNQWIEEYSRGNSGIEFSSSGVESRRNNVWSEATSSESVEMLLKSVGQEEKVVGKAVIEQLDIRNEPVSLTKVMDPNLNQESQISGGDLDSVIVNEKQNVSVLEEKVDNMFDVVIQEEPDKDHPGSSEDVGASIEEFKVQETLQQVSVNASGLSKATCSDAAEKVIQLKENSTNVPMDIGTIIVESCTKSLAFVPNVDYVENPSTETSKSFSENLSTETSITDPFIENLAGENSIPLSEKPSTETSIPFSANPSTETSITEPFSENRLAENSITDPFSENPSTETSSPLSENPSNETSIPFSKNLAAENSFLFSENASQMLKSKDPDSPKSNVGSLSKISPVKNEENETVIEKDAQRIISDASEVSAGNLPETGCKITSSELGAIHVDQDDSLNEKVDANLTLESSDRDIEVVRALNSQKKANTVPAHNFESAVSARVEQVAALESDKKLSADKSDGHATDENDDQPKSPIFGVSLVHQDNKEKAEVGYPSEGNSRNESVVASVSKNQSSLAEKEASPDLAENVHDSDVHCAEQEPETKNGGQECLKTLEKTGNSSQTGCLEDQIEVNKSNEPKTFVDVVAHPSDVAHDSSQPSKIADDLENKASSVSLGNTPLEEKNFTFEVNKSADDGQAGKGFPSYPTFKVSNLPKITEGPSKDSSSNQMDPKKFHEVSLSPQNSSGLTSQIGVKGTPERKPRRKSIGKGNARKGTTPARDSVRGEILPVTKPAGVLSSPKIPDLNNSTSIFQQPFTDNQQVQLRAQILVYGSLISGSAPEETHMITAFGQSDGGRTWEGVWRACLERLHVQKSQPKFNTPIQSRSDMRDAGSRSDQAIKQTSIQNKIPSSPIGGSNNKGTPPIVSPMIPLSSPLWNITTPGLSSDNNLQSSGMPKTARFDYHQTLSPLHPTYQAPPLQNHNSSWLSQGPFSGQWLAASPIPTFNPAPHFPSLPITESVKLTPVKESSGSGVVKHTSNPMVLNSAPIIFPEASSLSGMKRSTALSSDQKADESKTRKKKKGIPVVSIPFSTSVAVSTPAFITSKSSPAKFLSAVSSPAHHTKSGDQNVEKVVISEEALTKTEESKLQAKEATEHADNAMFHCNGVWSEVERRYNHGLNSDDEAKLVSSAVSIAAAASVAKVAAAAAKIASDVAEQARSIVNSLNKSQNIDQSKAASSSTKHAENLDAIVRAAELAAEAVSQAGKIVAMSEPFSLRDLVEAGPEGYWKTPRLASSKQQTLIAENLNGTEKKNAETAPDKGIPAGRDLAENQTMEVDGTSGPFISHEKDKRKPRAHRGPEFSRTVGAVPESEIGSIDTSVVGQTEPKIPSGNLNESDIKEGCLVEVYKDDDKYSGAWFGANVLSLKDGKALVSYTEIQLDEGSEKLKEWVPLEVEGNEAPKIRVAHPVTTMQGTRKRRRTAATDFVWSSGDRVDVWIQDHWREGVVMETNKIDTTSLTVQFPAQGETSIVRSWFVRPTLIWKDGKWIMCHTSEKRLSSPGNTPREKRLKLGSHVVESKKKDGSSDNIDFVEPKKQEESRTLSLSTHERVFNVGSTRDGKKVNTHRTMRSGLQKEGPGVIFGVPKPGKKQKFMDVSKHYVADGTNKNKITNDSIKFTRYLIPNPPGARGWKTNSRSDAKEKQAAETKPQMLRPRKPPIPSVRTLASSKSTTNKTIPDSVSDGENQSGQENQMEIGSSSSIEDKPERLNKRKFAPSTTDGKTAKVENPIPEVVEPRRSNRKIQPTSRLLEGLQSSMTISKMPALKVTPKGNTNNA